MPRPLAVLSLLAVIALAGCTRLSHEESFTVPAEGKLKVLDPVRSGQTIHVTATADAPISVSVFLQKDREAAEKEAMALKFTGTTLAHKEKAESITLDAAIPANEPTVVLVTNATAKAANVKLKITN